MRAITPTVGHEPLSRTVVATPDAISAKLCLALARSCLTRSNAAASYGMRKRAPEAKFESADNFLSERESSVDVYRALFAPFCSFAGKTVLELGCSGGYMLDTFLRKERFKAIGADIDGQALEWGRATYGDRIEFHQVTPSFIPLPNESVDIVYTIDTVEHLSRPVEIFRECHRILRPGGVCLVHFHPWLSPWGSHLEDIIEFPWPHAVFSMDTLLSVAAYLYESDDYVPAHYWIDRETGVRRPNPYLDRAHWHEFLNRMTIRRFRQVLQALPFEVEHFKRIGFGGRSYRAGRWLRGLAQVPLVDEFVAAVYCVLRRGQR